jgi:acylpyruvate hydrolase
MKIICIGRNYVAHAHELNNEIPQEPVFFMKPDSSLLRNNDPFYIPEWSKEIHHEIELVIKINGLVKTLKSALPIVISMKLDWELILLPAMFKIN